MIDNLKLSFHLEVASILHFYLAIRKKEGNIYSVGKAALVMKTKPGVFLCSWMF